MISFDDISIFCRDIVFYNVYALTAEDGNSNDIMLNEDNCKAEHINNFDFATGFASALLSCAGYVEAFVTKITSSHDIWNDKDMEFDENIIWQGTVNDNILNDNS